MLIERWRRHYDEVRLNSLFDYPPPAPVTITRGRADQAFTIPGLWPDRPTSDRARDQNSYAGLTARYAALAVGRRRPQRRMAEHERA